jgi:hypothetical protein
LPPHTKKIISLYLSLPIGTKPSCPYFNNRRGKSRVGLRVLTGKGLPVEIAEECHILGRIFRTDVNTLSTDKLKEFLVKNNLGVDCSGFAYHVLNTLSKEKTGKSIGLQMKSIRSGFLGKIIAQMRPAENLGVNSFHSEKNSKPIKASDASPGDIITFIGTGNDKTYNHILVVTSIEKTDDVTRISYAHSYSWPSDGLYNHGVREGDILVHGDDLLSGTWKEQGQLGEENYTYLSAKNAKEVSLRRLNFLS